MFWNGKRLESSKDPKLPVLKANLTMQINEEKDHKDILCEAGRSRIELQQPVCHKAAGSWGSSGVKLPPVVFKADQPQLKNSSHCGGFSREKSVEAREKQKNENWRWQSAHYQCSRHELCMIRGSLVLVKSPKWRLNLSNGRPPANCSIGSRTHSPGCKEIKERWILFNVILRDGSKLILGAEGSASHGKLKYFKSVGRELEPANRNRVSTFL